MLNTLFDRVRSLFLLIFGAIRYSPPPWMLSFKKWLSSTRAGRAYQWAQSNRIKAAAVAAASLACIAGLLGLAWWGMNYYDSLPKPNFVTIEVDPPREPDIETHKIYPVSLRFSQSAAPLSALDHPVTEGIELAPEVRGTWRWADDRTLQFLPTGKNEAGSNWQIDQNYKIKIGRGLLADQVKIEDSTVKFSTPPLKILTHSKEFYEDPRDPKIKRAVFNFTYNYAIDTEDFKKRVSVSLQSKDSSVLGQAARAISFNVGFGKFQNEAYVQSEPLDIPKIDSIAKIELAKGVKGINGGTTSDPEKFEVEVPGRFSLKIQDPEISFARNEHYEPEQVLIIGTNVDVNSNAFDQSVEVYRLPRNSPTEKGAALKKRHNWTSSSEVTVDVRKLMEKVSLTPIPTEHEASNQHSYKINVPVMSFLYVKVAKGMKSSGGYELAKDYVEVHRVPNYPKEILIMSQGAILTLSGEKKIPLLARNVRKVEMQISRILPDQLNQLINQAFNTGDFAHPNFDYFSDDSLSEKFQQSQILQVENAASTQYFSMDLQPYLGKAGNRHGLFYLRAKDANGNKSDQRLILLTDLGIIAKESVGHAHEVFVQNLRTGTAVAGALVHVIGMNGISILDVKTNADGRASFGDLKDFKAEKRPIAFVVQSGDDLSFLPFNMTSRELSTSKFDTGGIYESAQSDQLNAFAFSDRGIYRPGDQVNLGLIVRSKNIKKVFKDVPVTWSVTDPRGTEVHREKIKVNSSDLMALHFGTQDFSATGTYDIRIFITKKSEADQEIGSLSVRVEEFLPDRMRIATHLSQERVEGWVSPKDLKAIVSLKNLFGTAAENRSVKGTLTLVPAQASFRSFREYSFTEMKQEDKTFSEPLPSKQTDNTGAVEFDFDLSRFDKGMYNLRFEAEGFDQAGGRSVTASSSALVSSFSYLIGVKKDTDLSYLNKDSDHSIDVIAVNPELKRISINDLQVQIIERKFISSLMKQNDGTYKYQSVPKEILGEVKKFSVSDKGTKFNVPTDKPGDFAVIFKTGDGTELNRALFSVAGAANLSRSLEKNAELQLVLNKKDFKPGEEIEMQIKGPYVGAGLITIERDRVFASRWFKSTTTASVQKIKIPDDVEGNAYVSVTFLRAIDSKEIFMNPLSFAVQPFSVNLDAHKINIQLSTPERVRPGQKLKVTYSANKKTKMILYGVDEGILLVGHYRLPDPLNYFFQRRALQVRTQQILDLLMPEYSIVQSLSAPGGDAEGGSGKNLNPFKRKADLPVVFWSEVLTADSQKKDYVYEVPNYFNGSIKVMAVAALDQSLGAAEKPVLVRGDFILSPNVPSFVAPNDEFDVGVGVANQAEGSGTKASIKVELEASEFFENKGPASQLISIAEGHEGSVHFKLKAKSKLGSAPLRFRSSLGEKSAKSDTEMSIRPAVPLISTLTGGLAEKSSFEVSVDRTLLPEFRKQFAGMSAVPGALIDGLRSFLDQFNYGCTEQTISKGLPYVVLKARSQYNIDATKAAEVFKETISILRTRQTANGGFGMYSGTEPDMIEASLYAMQFFLEARERGFNVPEDLYERALSFVGSETLRSTASLAHARQFAYAIYLQARAGKVPSNDLNYLRQVLTKNYPKIWENDLTAAYLASTYRLLKEDAEGLSLFRSISLGANVEFDYDFFYDSLARNSTLITLAARHFPELLKDFVSDAMLRNALKPLIARQYNSYSAARSILALDTLIANAERPEVASQIKISEVHADQTKVPLNLKSEPLGFAPFSELAKKMSFTGPPDVPLYYFELQSGFDSEFPKEAKKKNLEIIREYVNAKDEPVNDIKVGDEITVRLRVRSIESKTISNVAIVDLLPGGFEIVLDSSHSSAVDLNEQRPWSGHSEGDIDHAGGAQDEGDEGEQKYDPPSPSNPEGDGAFYQWRRLLFPEALAEASRSPAASISALDPQFVDRREDRVVIYTSVSDHAQEFRYKIKAVNEGSYKVPPAFGESMYDRTVIYYGTGSQIRVGAP